MVRDGLEPDAGLRAHLRTCPRCRALVQALERGVTTLRTSTVPSTPRFEARLWARLEAARRWTAPAESPFGATLAIAASVVLAALSPLMRRAAPPPTLRVPAVAAVAPDSARPMTLPPLGRPPFASVRVFAEAEAPLGRWVASQPPP